MPKNVNMALWAVVLLALVALVPWARANAQDQGTGGTWQKLGTAPSPMYSLAADPSTLSTVYALTNDGISRSTDGGANWQGCSRDARYMRLVTPQASQSGQVVLYAAGPSGLRQSTDGCQTWKDVSSQGLAPSSSNVRWLAPYPNNTAVLYAGMDGLGGMYRSTDSGASWQAASKGLPPGSWVTALTADPRSPATIFVGVKYTGRVHAPAYVFRSTDGGLSWRSSSLGIHVLPNNDGEMGPFAWSGDTLFASTLGDGLYASTDRGQTWHEATLPRRSQAADSVSHLVGAPQPAAMPMRVLSMLSSSEGALIINTPEGAFRSVDGAHSWQSFGPQESSTGEAAAAMSLDANNRVVLASGGSLWASSLPSGIVAIPTSTPGAVAQVAATVPPPPLLPTDTPQPPTPTEPPTATPTPTQPPRPSGYLPSDRTDPLDPSIATYFPQTGHNIKYGFRDYWNSHDGIVLLGYPLTEEFVEDGVDVQYFERARLEYTDNEIRWSLLGAELTKGHFFQTVRFFPSEDSNVYFGPTQHSVSGPFLTFWRDNGGLNTFGYPLSQSFNVDGSEYQWFERARLEWHPWFPEGHRIVLGNIGTEYLQKRGWIK